jgi:hypothetical protein
LSTHSDSFADDLDGRALVTDYGRFGKRRRPLPAFWTPPVDDFGVIADDTGEFLTRKQKSEKIIAF